RKRIAADDGFVWLRSDSCDLREQATGRIKLTRVDPGMKGELGLANAQRHDNFFKRSIAGAFSNAIDGAFYLPRASLHRGQRVGARQSQVVMAVRRDSYFLDSVHALADGSDQLREFFRHGIPDGVWNIDHVGPGVHSRLDELTEEVHVGAGSVFRG